MGSNKIIFFAIVCLTLVTTENFEHKFVSLQNGLTLHYVEKGSEKANPVILLHGFPELWYSWKHQLDGLSTKYRVIAPDMRGYGESDKPSTPFAYDIKNLTSDVTQLMDALGIAKAHLVGHDWGAVISWWTAYLYPERFFSVTALSVPWFVPIPKLEDMVASFGDDFYINQFQTYGVAEDVLDIDIEYFFRLFFTVPSKGDNPTLSKWKNAVLWIKQNPSISQFPSWFSEDDLHVFVNNYKKNGFTAPLAYYRNWNRNIQLLENDVKSKEYYIDIPSYFIGGIRDLDFLKQEIYVNNQYLRNYEGPTWLDSGHFLQWEKPQEVTTLLENFFSKIEQKEEL